MELLVTGASGFLGTHLVERLVAEGHVVHGLLRASSQPRWQRDLPVKKFILSQDPSELHRYLKLHPISTIIHTASLFKHTAGIGDVGPLIQSNIELGAAILEASRETSVQWFINTASSWQHFQNHNYDPVNLYAATKEAFEKILTYYTQATMLKSVTVKLFDTYGPHDLRNKIIPSLKAQIGCSQPLAMSDGNQRLDLCHIDDIVRAYSLIVQQIANGQGQVLENRCFGLSSHERVSLRELVSLVEEITQEKILVDWGARPLRMREVMEPWESFTPLPGWSPSMGLRERLQQTLLASGAAASFKQE